MFRIMALGDIFGRSGRAAIARYSGELRKEYEADMVIANIENASGGNGVTTANARELLSLGTVDVFTSGTHIFNQKDVNNILQESDRLLRPENYPSPCPGNGWGTYRVKGVRVSVLNISGTTFMDDLDNPFKAFDRICQEARSVSDIICVDFHAEATSEKIAFGYYADGRAAAVWGTHTHVQTADERVLPGGEGYITDIGMCGPLDGVIGVDRDIIIKGFLTKRKGRHEPAKGPVQVNGAVFTFGDDFKCIEVERIRRIYDQIV